MSAETVCERVGEQTKLQVPSQSAAMLPWLMGRNGAEDRIGRQGSPTWKKPLMSYREMISPEAGKKET